MRQTLLDQLVEQARDIFWERAHQTAAIPMGRGEFLSDKLGDDFAHAVDLVVPKGDRKLLSRIMRDFMNLNFDNLEYDLEVDGVDSCTYADGEDLMLALIKTIIQQLVWQRNKMIALLLPNWFGSEYGRNIPGLFEVSDVDLTADQSTSAPTDSQRASA